MYDNQLTIRDKIQIQIIRDWHLSRDLVVWE